MTIDCEMFNYTQSKILEVAENTHNHILDRIDAYLELAQLVEKDCQQRAVYVQNARDLIQDEYY